MIQPKRVGAARAMQGATLGSHLAAAGKLGHRLFSEALDAYVKSEE